MLRGTLVSAIFSKSTEISITALDNSAAVTLMSTDVDRIVRGIRDAHQLWATVIQIGLATWLLEKQLGLACLAPVVVVGGDLSSPMLLWMCFESLSLSLF